MSITLALLLVLAVIIVLLLVNAGRRGTFVAGNGGTRVVEREVVDPRPANSGRVVEREVVDRPPTEERVVKRVVERETDDPYTL